MWSITQNTFIHLQTEADDGFYMRLYDSNLTLNQFIQNFQCVGSEVLTITNNTKLSHTTYLFIFFYFFPTSTSGIKPRRNRLTRVYLVTATKMEEVTLSRLAGYPPEVFRQTRETDEAVFFTG